MATQTASDPSCSSSSCRDPRYKYDVYLSCGGEDARRGFTDPLDFALTQQGIETFRSTADGEFSVRKSISPVIIFKAIEESRFSIVVLSRKYAYSRRCLDELEKIVECMKLLGHTIFPVYYDVDQAEVQEQTGIFAEAFAKHEQDFEGNIEKVPSWRAALIEVAKLSPGCDVRRYKNQSVEIIVDVVLTKLNPALLLENLGDSRSLGLCDSELIHKEKRDAVKMNIDRLQANEKRFFLDIACFFTFFKEMEKERVEEILGVYGCSPIQVLINNSLISILDNKLSMDALVQQTGQEIVFESFEEPGERSRLWHAGDIFDVFENNTGTDAVQGINFDFPSSDKAHCNSKSLSNMRSLRFLRIQNACMTEGPEYLSNALTYLEWCEYPSDFLPKSFQPKELCELHLSHGSIQQLWAEKKCLYKLKVINVSYSNLNRSPDFSGTPNLQRLDFEGCTNLVEIHSSIALLKWLKILNLKDCISLEVLPSKIAMESLEIFILSGCSDIKKIPEFVAPMDHLSELFLDETAIVELPLSIENLPGLTVLNLRHCKNLKCLPSNIHKLTSLKSLSVCGCSRLVKLPESLGMISCLEELDVGGTSTCDLPLSIFSLENLKVLSLHGLKGLSRKRTGPSGLRLPNLSGLPSLTKLTLSSCSLWDGTIPYDLGCLASLLLLDLSNSNCASLPTSIKQLSKLHSVKLEGCNSLLKIPDLSSNIVFNVGSDSCTSQERLSCSSNLFRMRDSCFNFINCCKLVGNQDCNDLVFTLLRRFLKGSPSPGSRFETIIPGSKIPECFSQNLGHVLSMGLPQDWYKKKLLGYAVCAVFGLRPYGTANVLGKWKFGTPSLHCEVRPNKLNVPVTCPFLGCNEELGGIKSDHLWFAFVSGEYFGTEWQSSCSHLEFSFEPIGIGLEVKKCGVRLIYDQDFEDSRVVTTQSRGIVSPCRTVNVLVDNDFDRSEAVGETSGKSKSKQDEAATQNIRLSKKSRN